MPPPRNEDLISLWKGLSCWSELSDVRRMTRMAATLPYIAVIELPDQCDVEFRQTGKRRSHHTLWGDPQVLKHYVIREDSFQEVEE
jgi:hypothetical protein